MTHPSLAAQRAPQALPARNALMLSAAFVAAAFVAAASVPAAAQTGPHALAHALANTLASGCAVARSASFQAGSGAHGSGFDAERLEIVLPGRPDLSFHAASLHASSDGVAVPPPLLERAATASAAVLATALSGHHGEACSEQSLHEAAEPLAHALGEGAKISFSWSGVSLRAGDTRFGAHHITLRAEGRGPTAHLTAVLDGAASNQQAAGLLPEALAVRAALPAEELPALLSATGGMGRPVDVTIEQADAKRGDATLSGQGHAVIATTPQESRGDGHITVHGYDSLLDAASAAGLERVRTALFLARLVAHRHGDQADWDLAWSQGTLLVNNVPLPLR